MPAGLQRQGRRAQHHLGGVHLRLGPGQPAGHAAVGQCLQHQRGKGGAAAGHGAARVHQPLLHVVQQARPGHGRAEGDHAGVVVVDAIGADHHQALAHGGGRIGVDADDGTVDASHLPDRRHGQPCRHRHQHAGLFPARQGVVDVREHVRHHEGLHAQEQEVALPGGPDVVAGPRSQGPGQRRRLFRGAVGQQYVFAPDDAAHRRRQRAAHVAAADKAKNFV